MSLETLTDRGLEETRAALALEVAALYLPVAGARLVLERFAVAAAASATHEAAARVVFDEAAWRLAVCGVAPLAICGDGRWLMENPFSPPATAWLLLPLVGHLGIVIGCTA